MRTFLVFIIFFLAIILFISATLENIDLTPSTPQTAAAAVPTGAIPTAAQPLVIAIPQSTPVSMLPTAVVPLPVSIPVTGGCADPYVVLPGDWLLKIARNCDTSLAAILQDNPYPQIVDPDLIYPDQRISLRSTSAAVPVPVTGMLPSIQAGSVLQVQAVEFPPNILLNVALGPQRVGYTILTSGFTDASGSLTARITIPNTPDPYTPWVVAFATTSNPPIQVVSAPFTIRP